MDRKKLLWSLVSVLLAALSVWAVFLQCRSFSVSTLIGHIRESDPVWLICAAAAMFCFIFFEAKALLCITRSFGYRRSRRDGFVWSASDIYFSAITPSATGGQPACAYFMVRDGVPGVTSAVALLANLAMYTLSIIVIGIAAILICPSVILSFSSLSRILIVAGFGLQLVLLAFFVLLLRHESLARRIIFGLISAGAKIKLIRKKDRLTAKAEKWMDDYGNHAVLLRGRAGMLVKVFFWNLAQRVAQISVTAFTYLAMTAGGGEGFFARLGSVVRVFSMQSCVVLGANMIPIPGAMGVTDYLMLDVFGSFMPEEAATSLELLSRSLSFYICIIICGAAVLAKLLISKRRQK